MSTNSGQVHWVQFIGRASDTREGLASAQWQRITCQDKGSGEHTIPLSGFYGEFLEVEVRLVRSEDALGDRCSDPVPGESARVFNFGPIRTCDYMLNVD